MAITHSVPITIDEITGATVAVPTKVERLSQSANYQSFDLTPTTAEPVLISRADSVVEIINLYMLQAQDYCEEKQWDKAIYACQEALQIAPTNADAYKLLGNIMQKQAKFTDAIGFYAKALGFRPNFPEVYSNLGTLYAHKQDWEKAVFYFQKAISYDAGFALAYLNLAKAYEKLEQPTKHLDSLSTALTLDPSLGSAEDHYKIAQTLLKDKQVDEAITFCRYAIDKKPDFIEAYQQLTTLLEEKGDWKSAAEYYRKVMDLERQANQKQANQTTELTPPSLSTRQPSTARRSLEGVPLAGLIQGLPPESQQRIQRLARASSQKKLLTPAFSVSPPQLPAAQIPIAPAIAPAAFPSPRPANRLPSQRIQQLQQAIKQNPRSAALYRELAKELNRHGRKQPSAQAWFRAFRLDPNWPNAKQYNELGDVLLSFGDKQSASVCYKQAARLQTAQESRQAAISSAERLSSSVVEQSVRSQSTVKPSLAKTPIKEEEAKRAAELQKRGESLKEQSRWTEAIAAYREVVQLKPSFSWAFHSLGDCYRQLAQWTDAIAAYREATRLNDEFVWSYYSLAECLEQTNAWREAADAYTKASEKEPDSPLIKTKLAEALKKCASLNAQKSSEEYLALAQSEGMDEAIYRKAIAVAPDTIAFYLNLGSVLIEKQQFDEAVFVYQTAVAIDSTHVEAHLGLAQVLSEQEKFEAAIACIHRAMDVDPSSYAIYFKLGEVLSKKGDLEGALAAFQKTLSFNSDFYWAYQCIGNVYLWMNDAENAVVSYQKAVEIEPNLAMAHKQMGEALTMLGDVNAASEAYARAIEIDPQVA